MSEVPDIVQSSMNSRASAQSGEHSATDGTAVVPANEDSSVMDAEDSLPAVHLQSESGDRLAEMPAAVPSLSLIDINDGVAFDVKITMLEQRELQAESSQITPELYSVLLTCYLIEQNWGKAFLCRMRASPFNDSELEKIIKISKHLENAETGDALRLIKSSNFTGLVETLMVELQSRIYLWVIRLVEKCYMTIESKQLAEMLGVNNDFELQRLLRPVGWEIDGDHFVRPSNTTQLQSLVDEKNNTSPYGKMKDAIEAQNAKQKTQSFERTTNDHLQQLTRITSFMEVNV